LSRRRLLIRGGVGIAGLVSLAGCATASTPAAPTTAAVAPPTSAPPTGSGASPTAGTAAPTAPPAKRGGTLNIRGYGEPPLLDPHLSATSQLLITGPAMAYSRLLQGKVGPQYPTDSVTLGGDLAESWEQPDETTFVFKIRQGVKWHNIAPLNGRDFTADDVVYSYQRQTDLKVNADFIAGWAKLEAPDKNTLRLQLKQPNGDYLLGLADGHSRIVAKEAVDLKGDLREGPTIGTGPFILDAYNKNQNSVFKRNPDHYDKNVPYVDGLVSTPLIDDATRTNALRSKQIDYDAVVSQSIIDAVKKDIPDLQVVRARVNGAGTGFGLRCDHPPLNNLKVRQAIMKGLDAQQIIDTVWFGNGWLSHGITMPSLDWYISQDELKSFYKRDVAAAKQLLAEAGVPNGFDLEIMVGNYEPGYVSQGELMAAQLKDIGVSVKLKIIPSSDFTARALTQPGDYKDAFLGPILTPPSANIALASTYHSKGARHTMHLNDPKLDDLIEKQSVMVKDVEGRKKALQEIQRYILTQAFYWPPRGLLQQNAIQPYVRNMAHSQAASYGSELYVNAWLDK
jgi:peptide/nickel transport system substrate-binding protein